MKRLKEEYRMTFTFLKQRMGKANLLMCVLFVVICAGSWVLAYSQEELMSSVMKMIIDMFNSKDVLVANGNISAVGLIVNNLEACLISALLGMIPFLFLPMVSLVMNGAIIGVMGAFMQYGGVPMTAFAAGLIPHGIFEIPALLLSMALGCYICWQITKKMIGKNPELNMLDLALPVLRIYILIIVPLILIAGVVEAYITPMVMNMFM